VIVLVVILAVVLAVVIGWVVVGLVFQLLWWALIGLLIGALARAILPGRQQVSLLATAAAGIAGSIFGGILAHAFGWGGIVQFLLAIGVAAAVIALLGGSRRARAY
jgi:uncharacterized membrane protein YeaQ/YmgE (transglycosylase-associated protein family)